MKLPKHGDARDLVLVGFVVVAGLGVFLFIPQFEVPTGVAASGIVLLLVLKHLGLLAAVAVPLAKFVRNHLRSQHGSGSADTGSHEERQ
jgi:hypothetical protein